MKKTILVVMILLMLTLGACSGQAASTTSAAQTTPQAATQTRPTQAAPIANASQSSVTLDATYENALPIPLQLLYGSLQLSGTPRALTSEQAVVLLPLWTSYQALSRPGQPGDTAQTDTSAQLDALAAQIEAAMTPSQLQAIAAMQLTEESAQTILQGLGVSAGGMGPGNGGGGQPPSGNGQPGGAQGTPPAGGRGNGNGNGNGGNLPEQGTPQAGTPGGMGQPGGGEMMLAMQGLNALIQQLAQLSGVSSALATAQAAPTGGGTPPQGNPNDTSSGSTYTLSGAYTLDGGTATQSGQVYSATQTDQSAIYVTNAGSLSVSDATITSSGDTSSQDNSSFHGLNAVVLAANGGSINLSGSTITSSGLGANGAFATDAGSTVTLNDVTINATGDGGHAVMATNGGVMTLTGVDITTAGKNSGAIATDRGGGTITVTGGTVSTSGQDSPAIYSTGAISVSTATLSASGAEAAVIEGANSITLTDCTLLASKEKWGVLIYQSMSGDAEGTRGVFTMSGGKLEYTPANGPLFYVTNSIGVITLTGVQVVNHSSVLLQASAGNWGSSGSNGGTVIFTAQSQSLKGDLTADNLSAIYLTLQQGSSLQGAINSAQGAKSVSLTLDASSTWNVTADSHLTRLVDSAGILGTSITNITGNGHTVTYDPASCPELGGLTYTLVGGGTLQPAS